MLIHGNESPKRPKLSCFHLISLPSPVRFSSLEDQSRHLEFNYPSLHRSLLAVALKSFPLLTRSVHPFFPPPILWPLPPLAMRIPIPSNLTVFFPPFSLDPLLCLPSLGYCLMGRLNLSTCDVRVIPRR